MNVGARRRGCCYLAALECLKLTNVKPRREHVAQGGPSLEHRILRALQASHEIGRRRLRGADMTCPEGGEFVHRVEAL
jgi:hypothetical protein